MIQLFVENLTNVDFSFLHPQRGLVGETWLVSCQVSGEMDEQGMICDFGVIKKRLRHWFDETLDHVLLVPELSDGLLMSPDENDALQWRFGEHVIECSAPKQALTFVASETITAESVARWCEQQLKELFPEVAQLSIQLTPESIPGAYYHYSHGLKKHSGNCQRIAHGHRSRLYIFRNGQRSSGLEAIWAERLADRYIGTREDISSTDGQLIHFAYVSQQGAFTLKLPRQTCYLIDTDTTVEWIAVHITDSLKQEFPNDDFTVQAFEGIGKGAIASR